MTAPVIPPDALKNGETNIQVTSLSSKTLTSYFWCNLIHSTFTSEFWYSNCFFSSWFNALRSSCKSPRLPGHISPGKTFFLSVSNQGLDNHVTYFILAI